MARLLLFWLCATTAGAFPIEYFQLGLTVPGFLSHLLPGSGADSHRAAAAAPTRSAEEETIGWFDPRPNGGRLLDYTTKKYGEPLNVIISGASDPYILTDEGFHVYRNARSLGYSEECLGMHMGHLHDANLGDGNGRMTELFLVRQYYFPVWGTCWESLAGGHHFRAWKQNGTLANSGAWFIGASKERDSSKNHVIAPDGYNIGRDWFVERAIEGKNWKGIWWKADLEWREGLLLPGRKGVNHGIEQDGRVAVLTVKRL
ncbi:hypothetical protein HYPSUDRAFT_40055 [Hypholoma sublateritium FD-334 SS-4]|uniref:Uncharacterized protein n=1 Tax=Hypholoma sublateritium (strain FD-334 SS-4) TaxID=945553 RepID=A0A0D2P3K9_HYPSF|nr:hypothetical protein HYPSUDRAFT_40055 [Hypholoma sublateritium FD-334 SS-4]